jgi:hypothetical protein
MDNQRIIYTMRDFEDLREQNKSSVIADEKKVRDLRSKKNAQVFF